MNLQAAKIAFDLPDFSDLPKEVQTEARQQALKQAQIMVFTDQLLSNLTSFLDELEPLFLSYNQEKLISSFVKFNQELHDFFEIYEIKANQPIALFFRGLTKEIKKAIKFSHPEERLAQIKNALINLSLALGTMQNQMSIDHLDETIFDILNIKPHNKELALEFSFHVAKKVHEPNEINATIETLSKIIKDNFLTPSEEEKRKQQKLNAFSVGKYTLEDLQNEARSLNKIEKQVRNRLEQLQKGLTNDESNQPFPLVRKSSSSN